MSAAKASGRAVLAVASECAPLIKTGGLADVVGALPRAMAGQGWAIRTLIPGYRAVMAALKRPKTVLDLPDLLGTGARVLAAQVAGLDLLVLERAYSMRKGQAMRLRLVPAAELAEGSIATGSILLAADKTYWIDNMEGMDVSSDEDGRVHVTLISDDNFSALQRTLLLEFVLE